VLFSGTLIPAPVPAPELSLSRLTSSRSLATWLATSDPAPPRPPPPFPGRLQAALLWPPFYLGHPHPQGPPFPPCPALPDPFLPAPAPAPASACWLPAWGREGEGGRHGDVGQGVEAPHQEVQLLLHAPRAEALRAPASSTFSSTCPTARDSSCRAASSLAPRSPPRVPPTPAPPPAPDPRPPPAPGSLLVPPAAAALPPGTFLSAPAAEQGVCCHFRGVWH